MLPGDGADKFHDNVNDLDRILLAVICSGVFGTRKKYKTFH